MFKIWLETIEGIKVYTGADTPFNKFDTSLFGSRTDAGFAGRGAYTTTDPEKAKRWGKYVMMTTLPLSARFLSIDKLSELYSKHGMKSVPQNLPQPLHKKIYKQLMDEFADQKIAEGYDGVAWKTSTDTQYILFKPQNFDFKVME
jgi:hypothetical protein